MNPAREPKSKGGRPQSEPHLQRINVPLRLPRWLVERLDAEFPFHTRAEVIEDALLKEYKLKAPKAAIMSNP